MRLSNIRFSRKSYLIENRYKINCFITVFFVHISLNKTEVFLYDKTGCNNFAVYLWDRSVHKNSIICFFVRTFCEFMFPQSLLLNLCFHCQKNPIFIEYISHSITILNSNASFVENRLNICF